MQILILMMMMMMNEKTAKEMKCRQHQQDDETRVEVSWLMLVHLPVVLTTRGIFFSTHHTASATDCNVILIIYCHVISSAITQET